MNNRLITALFAAITMALAGLVLVQWRWVSGTVALKDAQLAQTIDAALVAVIERLERIEAVEGIRGQEQGRRILEHLDDRDGADAAGKGEEVRITSPDGHVTIVRGSGIRIQPAPADSLVNVSGTGAADMGDREALLSNIIEGMLQPSAMLPMVERIDPDLLDSLLQEELRARGVQARAEHGVFDVKGRGVLLSLADEQNEPALAGSSHRVRLFPSDAVGEPYFLHVLIPGQERLVWRSMWPMVAVSALLILFIVLGFVHSVRTIQYQKRLSDIRNDLMNNLTHELKTPISTIALACEALNDQGLSRTPEQQRSFIAMIRDENKRLGILVESVLQSAVLDSGNMRLRVVDVDIHALLADVVRNASIQAEQRGGHLRMELRAELAHVRGDRIHLANVFYNLVDNAVKYCEGTPEVVMTTTSDTSGLTVRVSDNGIGIAQGEQPKIFDRLYRVPTGNLHNVKGFGLGLSYVHTVVAKHGGTIRVESEPGRGSTFIINLPFEHGEAHPPAALRG